MIASSLLTLLGMLHAQLPPAHGTVDSLPGCPWAGPSQFLANLPSPPDSAIVTVGGTAMKVCYSRPSARGRRVFGELVEYGKRWRTGANEPTIVFLSGPAEVAGVRLEAGRYVLMTIPHPDRWVILLNTSTASTPRQMFDALVEVGRGEVPVERLAAPVEQFRIRSGTGSDAGLVLEWERTRVRLPMVVRP